MYIHDIYTDIDKVITVVCANKIHTCMLFAPGLNGSILQYLCRILYICSDMMYKGIRSQLNFEGLKGCGKYSHWIVKSLASGNWPQGRCSLHLSHFSSLVDMYHVHSARLHARQNYHSSTLILCVMFSYLVYMRNVPLLTLLKIS